jgi:hypothetical protein
MRMTDHARKLAFDEREIVLRADLGDLDGECVWVSLRFMRGPRPPQSGEWVYLLDKSGRGCLGKVESVHGWVARVRPDWQSWSEPARPPAREMSESSELSMSDGLSSARANDQQHP